MDNPAREIHPELRQAARIAPRFTTGEKNLWLIRMLLKLMPVSKMPAELQIENIRIPVSGAKDRLRLRIYRSASAAAPAPALVWLHGGGYVMGRPEMDDSRCAGYAHEVGIVVISVDYRCAPEHPFPAGLEDTSAVVRWTAANAQRMGVDVTRIAIGGVSAGGGLAAAAAQQWYDRDEPPLAFQLLVYPMLDDRTSVRADPVPENKIAWSHANNRFCWNAYLSGQAGADAIPPYAVPARRANLTGLPPAWIGVGTADIFHDECTAYAERLKSAGVACRLESVPGAFHGFDALGLETPVIRAFRDAQTAALKQAFGL